MDELHTAEVLQALVANVLTNQTVFLSILSAYLVVAYTVGEKLTKYQVSFVNFVFLLSFINMSANQWGMVVETRYYVDIIREIRDTDMTRVPREITVVVYFGIRLLFLIGALGFMWSVRHPKTE